MKMHQYLLYSFICALIFFIRCEGVVVDGNGIVLPEVVSIFRHYKPLIDEKVDIINQKYSLTKEHIDYILHPDTDRTTISLTDLNAIGQIVFLRPANAERKDTVSDEFLPYTDQTVMNLFSKIGDVGDINPKKGMYKYILINGSTVGNMRDRIQTLIAFIEARVITVTPSTEIVFLTGERDLFDTETEEQLLDPSPLQLNPLWQKSVELPKTENKAAEFIWSQSLFPDSIRSSKVTFVSAKKNGDRRPTTYDTIKTWLEEKNPEAGNCVSISSQPHVYYQEATMQGLFKKTNLLEKGFSVEGVGFDKNNDFELFKNKIAVILDNLARTIYTEVQNAQ